MGQNSRQTILTRVFTHIKHDWSARAAGIAGIAGIGMAIFMAVVSIVIFMWPLLGIHRRLVQEKQLLLRESSQLLEVTIAELHGRVKAGELDSTNGRARAAQPLCSSIQKRRKKTASIGRFSST